MRFPIPRRATPAYDFEAMRLALGIEPGHGSKNEARDSLALLAAGYAPADVLRFLQDLDMAVWRYRATFETEARKRGMLQPGERPSWE
jgi:hypothetical protein